MLERFTASARAVMDRAWGEAWHAGNRQIGVRELFVELMADGGRAKQLLAELAGDDAFAAPAGPAADVPLDGAAPIAPAAQRVLDRAVAEADQLGHARIGTEHLLLAILADGDSAEAQRLAALGVTAAEGRELLRFRSTTPTEEDLHLDAIPLTPRAACESRSRSRACDAPGSARRSRASAGAARR